MTLLVNKCGKMTLLVAYFESVTLFMLGNCSWCS